MIDEKKLITDAAGGDADALTALIVRYTPMLKSVVANYYLAGADRDDLLQEAILAFIKAVKRYDPDKTAAFSSFSYGVAKKRILDVVKLSHGKKYSPLNDAAPISSEYRDEDGQSEFADDAADERTPIDSYIEEEDEERMSEAFRMILSEREREVLGLYLEGATYGEIGAKLSVSPKTVDNTLSRIRKKLRDKKEIFDL